MTIRILVNGAGGKMGQECVKTFQAHSTEFDLMGSIGSSDNLAAVLAELKPQIVVDFTTPQVVFENTLTIISSNIRPVIGTTGLTPEQITELTRRCAEKKLGGIIAPNFSIGAILMMRFAEQAAHYFADAEIIELHHPAKLDSPSGTALKTAELIGKVYRSRQSQSAATLNQAAKELIPGARGAQSHDIPIHAIRLPGYVASQEVLFGGSGENLTLRHHTLHRETFMPGVRLACQKVLELDRLVYGLENLL